MRYISLLIILSLTILTWHVSRLEASVPVSVHNDIQMDLAKIITEAIRGQLPSARNIEFRRLYSETENADEVRVFFEYGFEDGQESAADVATGISGQAVVKRNADDPGTWVLETVKLSESTLEFKDGIVVTREGVSDEHQDTAN
jgi:hypothetical protein